MNRYKGGFKSLENEIVINELHTEGEIPSWLDGTLLRTGPAKFEVAQAQLKHWFDGFAMLHSFTFSSGKIAYRNKFLGSDAYKNAKKSGKIEYREFATDPCRAIFKNFFTLFSSDLTDNGNVNVTKIANEYLALTETPLPVSFDKRLLETKGHFKFEDDLKGQITTAHPHFDLETKEGFNYITKFGSRSYYQIYKIAEGSKKRQLVAKIPTNSPSYMHSFGLTKNYVILLEWPLMVNSLSLVFGSKPFIENYKWKPETGLKFNFIDRTTGKVTTLTSSDVYFAFHHINAFEQDEQIIIDACAYQDPSIIKALYLEKLLSDLPSLPKPHFRRFTCNLNSQLISSEQIIEEPIELPRLNYGQYNTKPYNFAYGASFSQEGDFLNQLVKVDIQNKRAVTWHEDGLYPGEPVFIAHPNATREDEGIILSVALDAKQEKSKLIILNAQTFKELGRAFLPHVVPFGFHGNFYK